MIYLVCGQAAGCRVFRPADNTGVKLKELKKPAGKGVSGKSCALYNDLNALLYPRCNIILLCCCVYIESTAGKRIIIIKTPNRRERNVIGLIGLESSRSDVNVYYYFL